MRYNNSLEPFHDVYLLNDHISSLELNRQLGKFCHISGLLEKNFKLEAVS